jgi:hypothetical protein
MSIMENKPSSKRRVGTRLLMLAGICAALAAPGAWAHRPPEPSESQNQGAHVMSHLPLDESTFQDAIYRESGGHRYLYIQNAGSNAATIIDVSQRKKPKVTGSITLPEGARLSDATFQGDVVMVSSGGAPTHVEEPTLRDITIWDISKPGAPKVVKHFNHVKKILSSSGGINYVLDADGLWVVQTFSQQMRDWDNYLDHLGP